MNNLMKIKVQELYGNRICCSEGVADASIQLSVSKYVSSDLAIYFNDKYRIAIVWDLKHRKRCGATARNLSLSKSWSEIKKDKDEIFYSYKNFKTENGYECEKVIWFSYEIFSELLPDIFEYLKFELDEYNEIPEYDKYITNPNYDWTVKENRERISTSTWKRKQIFRKKVLDVYENQCAICRCTESKILEAAHIISVADGGSDDINNGICLCRNHHRMFDEKLICINFDTLRLDYVSPTVKKMSWYSEFNKTYKSKIKKRVKIGEN